MSMRLLGIVVAVAGVGALIARGAEGGVVERERKRIRKKFTVTPDCVIEYKGDPADAAAFWASADEFLQKMVELAAPQEIRDPAGLASYTMLVLFPECDQTGQLTPSFLAVRKALEFRFSSME